MLGFVFSKSRNEVSCFQSTSSRTIHTEFRSEAGLKYRERTHGDVTMRTTYDKELLLQADLVQKQL
jgi:hypothetical protein